MQIKNWWVKNAFTLLTISLAESKFVLFSRTELNVRVNFTDHLLSIFNLLTLHIFNFFSKLNVQRSCFVLLFSVGYLSPIIYPFFNQWWWIMALQKCVFQLELFFRWAMWPWACYYQFFFPVGIRVRTLACRKRRLNRAALLTLNKFY